MLIKADILKIQDSVVLETIEFKIQHFRHYNNKVNLPNGGYTCLSMVENNKPFSVVARCSHNQAFSRKHGVYECLKKYIQRFHADDNSDVLVSLDRTNPRHYAVYFSVHKKGTLT
jgi:hypothetical protein